MDALQRRELGAAKAHDSACRRNQGNCRGSGQRHAGTDRNPESNAYAVANGDALANADHHAESNAATGSPGRG